MASIRAVMTSVQAAFLCYIFSLITLYFQKTDPAFVYLVFHLYEHCCIDLCQMAERLQWRFLYYLR